MSAPGPRLFVSYARSDGKAFAQQLSVRLREAGFSLWRDLADLEGGRDWWQQIEEAIRAAEYLILVITPAALRSDYVRKEWRFTRRRDAASFRFSPTQASPRVKRSARYRDGCGGLTSSMPMIPSSGPVCCVRWNSPVRYSAYRSWPAISRQAPSYGAK